MGDNEGGLDLGLDRDEVKEQQETAEKAREQKEQEAAEEAESSTDQNTTESIETDEESSSEAEEADDTADVEEAELQPVKERDHRVLAYNPPTIKDEWELAVTQVQLTWQQSDYDGNLDKLRHLYPILLKVGAENAEDLTADEIHEYKTEIEKEDRETL